jgi:hypothetical protein
VKIIYTRGNRTETLASLATLRQILDRFVGRRVFYELSGRQRRGRVFFSVKNVFTVGSIEITNLDQLHVLIFDSKAHGHSIEVVNPHTMKIYDELPHRSFAVAFVSEDAGTETRCYIRDEGSGDEAPGARTALEEITLPELFDYLQAITTETGART